MKRRVICFLLAAALLFTLGIPAFAKSETLTDTVTYRGITVTLNDTPVTLVGAGGAAVEPFLYKDTTYLPLRAVGYALGLNVGWDNAGGVASLDTGGTVKIGTGAAPKSYGSENKTIVYRDIKLKLNGTLVTPIGAGNAVVEPFMLTDAQGNGTVYLPLRAVANLLGLEVGWDDATSTVSLNADAKIAGARQTHAFTKVWHADEIYDPSAFSLDKFDSDAFSAAAETMRALAASGGSRESFNKADDTLDYWTLWLSDACSVAMILMDGDPADEDLMADFEEIQAASLNADNIYQEVLQAVALSKYSDVMKDYYTDEEIEAVASMQLKTEEDDDFIVAENALVRQYYTLMAGETVKASDLSALYIEMVELRNDYAVSLGYESFADYAYAERFYRDYSPENAKAFHAGVKKYFAPIIEAYGDAYYDAWTELNTDRTYACDPDSVLAGVSAVIPGISTEIADSLAYMLKYGLYDIAPSDIRTDTGYTTLLYTLNEPYLYNMPYDNANDYFNFVHELGHFTNFFYTECSPYGESDIDLSEVQSQGLELIFAQYCDSVFGAEKADAARTVKLLAIMDSILSGSLYDEFQQRVYSTDDLTPEKLDAIFKEVYEAYGYGPVDGNEFEWMSILHNFAYPFYYISYGTSALGALEIYALLQTDEAKAIDCYLNLCAMNTQAWYYSEALEEVGLGSFLEDSTYAAVADAILAVLQ